MTIKLGDAELVLLFAAEMRDDKCVPLPAKLSAARLRKVGGKLIEAGVAREVKAKASSPIWRRDVEGDVTYALKLTAAGIKTARQVEAKAGPAPEVSDRSDAAKAEADSPNVSCEASACEIPPRVPILVCFPPRRRPERPLQGPRSGSKIGTVIRLLGNERGVTISELIEATGWLPHTTRAALTGLRKRGYSIALDRSDRERGSAYQIEAQ